MTQPDQSESERERDERAVAVAESLWPTRYVGDLTTDEWRRVYRAVDAAFDEGHTPSMVTLCKGQHPWNDKAASDDDRPRP